MLGNILDQFNPKWKTQASAGVSFRKLLAQALTTNTADITSDITNAIAKQKQVILTELEISEAQLTLSPVADTPLPTILQPETPKLVFNFTHSLKMNLSGNDDFNMTSVSHGGNEFKLLSGYNQFSSHDDHYQILLSSPEPTIAAAGGSLIIMLDNSDDLARVNHSLIKTGKFEQPGIKIEISESVKVSQTATTVEVAL